MTRRVAATAAELRAVADMIDGELAEMDNDVQLRALRSNDDWTAYHRRRRALVRTRIFEPLRAAGAATSETGLAAGSARFRHFGIVASSTGGLEGALRNWSLAAHKAAKRLTDAAAS